MVKRLVVAVFLSCLLVSGCARLPKQGNNHVEKNLSLENWMEYVAVPYLIRELGENPRFKGQPFLLVSMDRDNVEAEIDDLTMQLREEMIDGLLTKPGIGLVWRPSTKPWEHHTSLKQMQCNESMKEKYYVGIDTSLSSVNGKLKVKIRALDIAEKGWVTGFGVSWQGSPSAMHKKALRHKTPDDCLLGLRPRPFDDRQADLLASYLSRNLSCLFANMELDEAMVYVKKDNPGKTRYFNNALGLVANYLARYREVMVTDDPAKANITILTKVHEIHKGLYQVWMSARYKEDKKYIPGRETEAYVSLSMAETVQQDQKQPHPLKKTGPVPQKSFDLCFYDYLEDFETRIYPMLKRYPGVNGIRRLYNRCANASSCVCYEITVDSKQYEKMEELTQWLDSNLEHAVAYRYKLKPLSSASIRIIFNKGFN
jgi:hypothetical protein